MFCETILKSITMYQRGHCKSLSDAIHDGGIVETELKSSHDIRICKILSAVISNHKDFKVLSTVIRGK